MLIKIVYKWIHFLWMFKIIIYDTSKNVIEKKF